MNVQLLPPKNDFRGKFVTLACNLDERFGDFIADVRSDFKKEVRYIYTFIDWSILLTVTSFRCNTVYVCNNRAEPHCLGRKV